MSTVAIPLIQTNEPNAEATRSGSKGFTPGVSHGSNLAADPPREGETVDVRPLLRGPSSQEIRGCSKDAALWLRFLRLDL